MTVEDKQQLILIRGLPGSARVWPGSSALHTYHFNIKLHGVWLQSHNGFATEEAAEVGAFKLARKLGLLLRDSGERK